MSLILSRLTMILTFSVNGVNGVNGKNTYNTYMKRYKVICFFRV